MGLEGANGCIVERAMWEGRAGDLQEKQKPQSHSLKELNADRTMNARGRGFCALDETPAPFINWI